MSPYSGQSLSYWVVIRFSQDIRHGFRQIDMLWIPYLSDYLFWKFTYLVMVITWSYLTIFVHQVCLFTFRHFGPNSGQCLLQENQKSYIQAGALFEIFRARGKNNCITARTSYASKQVLFASTFVNKQNGTISSFSQKNPLKTQIRPIYRHRTLLP